MNIEQKILIAVKKRKSPILLRKDVSRFGSRASVSRALRALIEKGAIVRLGYGVYARARINSFTKEPAPDGWFYDLAYEALNRLGVETEPGEAMRLYNEDETTQIPAVIKVKTPNRRITRKLSFKNQVLPYE